ncbi:hypothetical protein B5X24_HaOG211166 [Helicoverpa armigera]|nr:hypothetical protein B5X24_HaOG211166 [Helicoverpa armigera]
MVESPEPHTPNNRPDKHKKKNVTTQSEEEYTLSAAVVCVEDNPKNLVAYIQTAAKDVEPVWYLFNDLSIVPVPADEVVQFGACAIIGPYVMSEMYYPVPTQAHYNYVQ